MERIMMKLEVKEGVLQQWHVKILSFHCHLLLLRHDLNVLLLPHPSRMIECWWQLRGGKK